MRLETVRKLATNPRLALQVLRYGRLPSPRYVNLKRVLKEVRPRRIVEIGVWHGAAAMLMLRRARRYQSVVDYWGFDLFEEATPEVLEREACAAIAASQNPPPPIEVARQRLEQFGATVHLIQGDSTVTVPQTRVPPADLIFIDGGHSYETVCSDWENVQRFVHDRTVVIFDDYTNQYGVEHGYGIKRLVDELDRERWEVRLLMPIDRYRRPDGVLESQFARVRRQS
jgi:predicted O-methyltransferase YrrM